MPLVHLEQRGYRQGLKDQLEQAVRLLGGWNTLLGGRKRILLKPNLVLSGPPTALRNTHPLFILAVAELLLDQAYLVGVADSPGTGSAEAALDKMEVLKPLQARGVKCFSFRQNRSLKGLVPDYPGLGIAKELSAWEGMINLPKLKSHQQTLFSGATKNLFGCLAGKKKALLHVRSRDDLKGFLTMIHALAKEANPLFHLADGIKILHHQGPIEGQPFDLGAILASTEALQLDWLFCRLVGLDPARTPLFSALGPIRQEEVWGDPVWTRPGFIPPRLKPIRFRLLQVSKSLAKAVLARFKPNRLFMK